MVDQKFPELEALTESHIDHLLKRVSSVTVSFDLWMSRKADDIMAVVIHFLDKQWQWRHPTLGLLHCTKGTSGNTPYVCVSLYNTSAKLVFQI